MIDSPVYPDELEALGGVLEQAGFPVSGLLATHADWDHLLGRLIVVLSHLDAAGLAPAADLDLGLDHARIADVIGRRGRLVDGLGMAA